MSDTNQLPRYCPACRTNVLREPQEWNALSRFALDKYICGECGAKEATSGFFWIERARRWRMRLKPHHVATYGFGGPRK